VEACCEACSARSRGQQMSAVRQRSTGAERHCDKDRFAELDLARAGSKRCFAMVFGIAPSASPASSGALKPAIVRGAKSPSSATFFKLLMSNIRSPFD
jgi:hypothetical protein